MKLIIKKRKSLDIYPTWTYFVSGLHKLYDRNWMIQVIVKCLSLIIYNIFGEL